MKCFRHPTHDAVGVCKQCQKGVCIECAVDVDAQGLACRETCVEGVKRINDTVRANTRASALNVKQGASYTMPLFLAAIGAVTLIQGAISPRGISLYDMLFSGVFIAFAAVFAIKQRAWWRKVKNGG